jgi:sulfide:quinone oxidoreductase
VGATPGLAEGGDEFYSFAGAERLCAKIPSFTRGRAIVGVTSTPFKCPPAPSEAAVLLHDHLLRAGVRNACEISLVMPFGTPIPPAPDASRALLAAFEERGIAFVGDRLVASIDPARHVAVLSDGSEMPFDLFLGVPKHCVPEVVERSGLAEDGWVPVDPRNLKTKFAGVYAVGDVNSVGTAKAGVFAEGAARVAAESIIADLRGDDGPPAYTGAGACYIEFGAGAVGRVDVSFLTGPKPTGVFHGSSAAMIADKMEFGASRRRRWFGLP